jgi:hypothetical protein
LKRRQHFIELYETFERTLRIELPNLREQIRVSWIQDLQDQFDEIIEKCLLILTDQDDGSENYVEQFSKAKQVDHYYYYFLLVFLWVIIIIILMPCTAARTS